MIMASRSDQASRELDGSIGQSGRQYFLQPYVGKFAELEPYEFNDNPDVIYIGIDPSGGGQMSDYAICSLAIENDKVAIISLDLSDSAEHNVVMQMLTDHLIHIREDERYTNALFVIFIEANMSWITTSYLSEMFRSPKFGNVKVVSRDPNNIGRYGVVTDNAAKQVFAHDLEQVMSDGCLRYADNFLGDAPQAVQKTLESQMAQYRSVLNTNIRFACFSVFLVIRSVFFTFVSFL